MIEIIDNITAYFDDDVNKIIYKDLKLGGMPEEEIEKNFKNRYRDLPMLEINVFQLNEYKFGSIGFTERELQGLKFEFLSEKLISNDYNGENPTNKVAYVKILFDEESKKILGCQIVNEKNVETRLKVVKTIIEKAGTMIDLMKYQVNPTDNEWNPDILNILAMMASQKEEESNDVCALDIEELVKNKKFLLDVREDYEYEAGHIKGAVNMPLREILMKKDSLPKNEDIYVYCRSNHRSLDATNFMRTLGFTKVHNVLGGYIDISFNEFYKDKGNLENSILTNYNFD